MPEEHMGLSDQAGQPRTQSAHDEVKLEDHVGPGFPVGLSADQYLRVQRWFDEKWRHGKCPVCGEEAFLPPDRIWRLRSLESAPLPNRFEIDPVFPCFAVVCSNCGYTIWINAAIAAALP